MINFYSVPMLVPMDTSLIWVALLLLLALPIFSKVASKVAIDAVDMPSAADLEYKPYVAYAASYVAQADDCEPYQMASSLAVAKRRRDPSYVFTDAEKMALSAGCIQAAFGLEREGLEQLFARWDASVFLDLSATAHKLDAPDLAQIIDRVQPIQEAFFAPELDGLDYQDAGYQAVASKARKVEDEFDAADGATRYVSLVNAYLEKARTH